MDLAKIRKKAKKKPGRDKKSGAATKVRSRETTSSPKEKPAPKKTNGKKIQAAAIQHEVPDQTPYEPLPVNVEVLGATRQVEKMGEPEGDPVGEKQTEEFLKETGDGAGSEKLLIFNIGRQKYAIPIHDVALVINERVVTPVPNAPPFLKGILSLRGKIVSVIDVAARLGLETGKEAGKRKIIILDLGSDRFGLLVDTIEHLAGVDIQVLEAPPESFTEVSRDFVEGVFHHSGHAVAFMNLPMFLNFTH